MLTGECYCGSVKYQLDGDLIRMYCCHCRTCRKVTGASFSTTAVIDPALFRVVEGEEHVVAVPQGPHHRHHCSSCHSWVFSRSEPFPDVMFIPCGTLTTTPRRKIDYHVFYSQKADWIEIKDDVPVYSEMLPEEELAKWAPA
jgi:hypothetical protein